MCVCVCAACLCVSVRVSSVSACVSLCVTPVCPFKTSASEHSKRPRICRHHAYMCFTVCAWCTVSHGDVLNVHTDVFTERTHGVQGRVILRIGHSRIFTYRKHIHIHDTYLEHINRIFHIHIHIHIHIFMLAMNGHMGLSRVWIHIQNFKFTHTYTITTHSQYTPYHITYTDTYDTIQDETRQVHIYT